MFCWGVFKLIDLMRSNSCVEPNNRSVACRPGCAGGGTKKGDLSSPLSRFYSHSTGLVWRLFLHIPVLNVGGSGSFCRLLAVPVVVAAMGCGIEHSCQELSLHDALPICGAGVSAVFHVVHNRCGFNGFSCVRWPRQSITAPRRR